MKYRSYYIAANTKKYALWHVDLQGELTERIQDFEGDEILSYTFMSDDICDNEYGDFETIESCKKYIDELVKKEITAEISERLEYLRGEIEAEKISYGEIAELQSLEKYIDSGDVVLLEWAGVEQSDTWADYVKERYTSRSGFWSNYDSDVKHEDWTADVLDECQYKTMIECWLQNKHDNDPNNNKEWSELEWELANEIDVYGFDSVADAIFEVEKLITTEAK